MSRTIKDLTQAERRRIVAEFKSARNATPPWLYDRRDVIKATAKMLVLDEDTVRQVLREEGE